MNQQTISFTLSSPSLLGDCSIGIKDYRSLYLFWLRLSFSLFFKFLHELRHHFTAEKVPSLPSAFIWLQQHRKGGQKTNISVTKQSGFCVRGILTPYLNPSNKRDSWVTSRGNSLRWLGQLLAEAQVWALSTEVSLASTGSAWTQCGSSIQCSSTDLNKQARPKLF